MIALPGERSQQSQFVVYGVLKFEMIVKLKLDNDELVLFTINKLTVVKK